ncbi:MAG: hypothetical protein ACTSRZ_13795 [Promethearchaeota archaeon]
MDKNIKIAFISTAVLGIVLVIAQEMGYYEYLDLITQYIGYVTPVVDTVINFAKPLLELTGTPISNFVDDLLALFPYADYTYYMAISFGIIFIAFVMAIKFPGYDEPKKKKKKE